VDIPEDFHRFWRALDELMERVQPTWWGAVVTDSRFPAIWDANYARIDSPAPDLSAAEIQRNLKPALRASGATMMHVVSFHPQETTGLLAELSTHGHKLGWDLVMRAVGPPAPADPSVDVAVEEIAWGPEIRQAVIESLALFNVDDPIAVSQLLRQEDEVLIPAGTRWFAVRDEEGRVVSLAALLVLDGVGYIDNVATLPQARRRGYAGALALRCRLETLAAGVSSVCLLADPDNASVVTLYERAGFHGCGKLGSTKGPILRFDDQSGGGAS
jgi:GNAT superfamily N-acetyltransferase